MKMQQCQLAHGDTKLTCWLESGRARPGYTVTLKNFIKPDWQWFVVKVGQEKDFDEINRVFQVGGM